MLKWLTVALMLAALPIRAETPDTAARIEAAYRAWVAEVGADRATLSIWRGDTPVRDIGINTDPQTPMPLASLGKAITGICAISLILSRDWQLDTTISDVLKDQQSEITVSQLLTHTSGLGPDGTQGLGMLLLFNSPSADQVLSARALGRAVQEGTPRTYAYNNENYAILGAMIAAQTGQSVEKFCTAAVLVPARVRTARPHDPISGMLSFGGWEMSVADYARFMHWAYGPAGIVGRDVEDWPSVGLGGGARYGVGMVNRPFRDSQNFWHFGLLCFPARANAGSYAVSFAQDWRVVAAFDGCVTWDQQVALDAALAGAVFP